MPSDRDPSLNVFGESLIPCSTDPMTGFFRDGCCNTSEQDVGSHTVCVVLTDDFLEFSKSKGNDLTTPMPAYGFPGLKGGERWCLCARRWLEASTEGGEIIHITSIAGMTGNGSSLAYCASKAALINMTLSMARILAPKIRVNAVAPGFIADQWTQQGLGERYGAAVQTHTQKALLGKVSEPEDVEIGRAHV